MTLFKTLGLLGLIYHAPTFSSIKEHYAMHEANDILQQVDEHTLVLFDVDETLIMPVDRILLPHFFDADSGKSIVDSFEQKAGNELDMMWSYILLQSQRKLIDTNVIDIINTLQFKGVKVLGLTRMGPGPFGAIESLAEYRFQQLLQYKIEFYKSFAQNIEFTQFSNRGEGIPSIYKGVIMTGHNSKGDLLGAFIDLLDYAPTKVIFFDDLLENIVDVGREMQKRNIEFHGFHYRAVELVQDEPNYETVQFQFDYLQKHHVWLSTEEALRLMQN